MTSLLSEPSESSTPAGRQACLRCRRPQSVCYCAKLPRLETKTRVVFLQHPRERKVAVSTARMAHLSLPNSELHQGLHFDGAEWLEKLAADPQSQTAILFPGPQARTPSELGWTPKTLIVLDGTWSLAPKLLKMNRVLQKFPQLAFTPERPGNYRIRKEPAEHCLSTVEAVSEVLGTLEGKPGAFAAMLDPFNAMVETQLQHVERRQGPGRFKRKRHRDAKPPPWESWLPSRAEDLVLVYAEANVWGHCEAAWYPPELVQWVAVRWATGERFEAFARPAHPLGPHTAEHLDVSADSIHRAPSLAEGVEAFRRFLRPNDALVSWSHYPLGLLRSSGVEASTFLELRSWVAAHLGARADGVEDAAQKMAAQTPRVPWAPGRAGRRLAALVQVVDGMAAASTARHAHAS